MESIKLFTNKTTRFGQKINIGGTIIGINEKGETFTEDISLAKKLVETYGFTKEQIKEVPQKQISVSNFDEYKRQKEAIIASLEKELKEAKEEIERLNLLIVPTGEKTDADILDELKGKTKKELLDLCKSMEFKESEYINLKIEELRLYITKKAQ